MQNIGIIAEYNPFHLGHAYQLAKVRAGNPRAKIIIFMSSYLVQRGEPALVDPFLRAKTAVRYGADLVLGVPSTVSCQSAESYAGALMEQVWNFPDMTMQYVGTESASIETIKRFADKLYPESEALSAAIQAQLRSGKPWPQARLDALVTLYPDLNEIDLLREPNHILTLEYILASKRDTYRRTPLLRSLRRIGHGDAERGKSAVLGSASAIRELFRNKHWPEMPDVSLKELKRAIPTEALAELLAAYSAGLMVRTSDIERSVTDMLIASDRSELETYFGNEMAAHIINHREHRGKTLSPAHLITRQWTGTRLSRATTRMLFHMGQEHSPERARFLRLLAYSPDGRYVLRKLKDQFYVPIIHRAADVIKHPDIAEQYAKERAIATLWYRTAKTDPARFLTPAQQYKPIKNLDCFSKITDD